MVAVLMVSGKMTTLGLLNTKVFQNKGYDVIMFVHDVTKKLLSRKSNYIVDLVMKPKFCNSSISMWEVIMTSILQGLDQKSQYFREVLLVWVQFETGTRCSVQIFPFMRKGSKLKVVGKTGRNRVDRVKATMLKSSF